MKTVILFLLFICFTQISFGSEKQPLKIDLINKSNLNPQMKIIVNELWYTFTYYLHNDGCYHLYRQAHMTDAFGCQVDYEPIEYHPNFTSIWVPTVLNCMDEQVFENYC